MTSADRPDVIVIMTDEERAAPPYESPDVAEYSTVTVPATSVDTNNSDRDKHVRSPELLGVEEHPQIVFEDATGEFVARLTRRADG